MQLYVWIIAAFLAATLTLSVLILCCILILKLPKNRLRASRRSIIVRPEIAKPINAFDESSAVYARISSPSVITVPEYPLHKTSIREPEQSRASSRKSNWMSDTAHCTHNIMLYAFSGRSKQRNGHFVDRDPPSDESKCDYLDPLDLNLSQLHDIYIANSNHHQSKQTDWLPNNKSTVTTYA